MGTFRIQAIMSLVLLALAHAAIAVPVVAIDVDPSTPGTQTELAVEVNDVFDVDLVITGVEDPGLNGFQLDLLFDPAVLQLLSADDGDFLPAPVSIANDIDNVAGSLLFSSLTPSPIGVSGDGVLATLAFQALAGGTSLLELDDVQLSAPFGVAIPLGGIEEARVLVQSAVPEPTVLSLFAAALMLTAFARRRGFS